MCSGFFFCGLPPQSKPADLPAPSGREPLAKPDTLQFNRELSRHAKGPILEGAVERMRDWGSLLPWLTPSVKACGFATFPKGTASAVAENFAAAPKGAPLGELASAARLKGYSPQGSSPAFPQRRAFAESGAANAVFLYDPSREKAILENPQIFQNCEIINNLSAATTTTAASGGNREELLGQRPARRECRPRHEADAGCRNPEEAARIQNRPTRKRQICPPPFLCPQSVVY